MDVELVRNTLEQASAASLAIGLALGFFFSFNPVALAALPVSLAYPLFRKLRVAVADVAALSSSEWQLPSDYLSSNRTNKSIGAHAPSMRVSDAFRHDASLRRINDPHPAILRFRESGRNIGPCSRGWARFQASCNSPHGEIMKAMHVHRGLFSVAACLSLGLTGCGSGGGGSTPPPPAPTIQGTVLSFPSGAVPPGFASNGFDSAAVVAVMDASSGAPVSSASVSINGISLPYVAADQVYEAELNLAPGASIALTVNASESTFSASGTQFAAYPTITSPLANATWSTQNANSVAWSSVATPGNSLYALGVFDTTGHLLWPATGAIQTVSPPTTSFVVPAGSVSVGSRLVLVGVTEKIDIPSAGQNSGLIIAGFNYVPISVSSAVTSEIDAQSARDSFDTPLASPSTPAWSIALARLLR